MRATPGNGAGAVIASMAVLVAVVAAGCKEEEPARLQVKLPKDSPQSSRAEQVLKTFTKKGQTVQLRTSAFDAEDTYMGPARVTWSVEDGTIASVDAEGLVTILSSGTTKVIATGAYERPLTAELPITAAIVGQVKIKGPSEGKVHLGEILKLEAQVLDDRGNPIPDAKVHWEANNFGVDVSPTGEVEGRAMGDAKVTAESGGFVAQYDVAVLDWR